MMTDCTGWDRARRGAGLVSLAHLLFAHSELLQCELIDMSVCAQVEVVEQNLDRS